MRTPGVASARVEGSRGREPFTPREPLLHGRRLVAIEGRSRILLPVAALMITAAVAGITFAAAGGSGSSQPVAPAAASPATGGEDDMLRAASARAGFPAKVPGFLPTSADRLVLADASTGPGGVSNGLRLIELVFESDRTVVVRSQQVRVSTEMFLTNVRLLNPAGERQPQLLAGYEVYSQVVDRDEAGSPIKVSYTALGNNETIIVDFTGEQPTQDDLVKMLGSLRVVSAEP